MKKFGGIFCIILFIILSIQVSASTRSSLAVTGNWSNPSSWNGGILPTAGDTVYIATGANITLDLNVAVKAIRINTGATLNIGSQTLSLTGDNDKNGNVSIYGTLSMNDGTINLTGIWNNNGTFNCGTGTVNFNGNYVQAIEGSSLTVFNNLYNNNPNTTGTNGISGHPVSITIKGDFIQNGQFHRNSNGNPDATIIFDGNTTLSGAYSYFFNHVVINPGATLNAGSKNIIIYGNWTNNGTFNCGTGTLTIAYDSYSSAQPNNQYIYQPSTQPFYHIYVSKGSGSVKSGIYAGNSTGDLVVNGNFYINSGTWDVNGPKNLYVFGHFQVNSIANAIFSASNGNLILNGNTLQILKPGTSSLYNLTISNSGAGAMLGSDVTISNSLNLNNGLIQTKSGTGFYEVYLSNSSPSALMPGYSSTSFIKGKFRRELESGAGTYIFPIGPVNRIGYIYRPVTLNQTSANGASSILLYEDTISSTDYKASWWLYMQPFGGNPTGTITNNYIFSSDFPAGTNECAISLIQGTLPPPGAWTTPLETTTGAASGTITSSCPGTYSPFAFILGEHILKTNPDTICEGNTVTLSTDWTGGSGTIRWYDASTGGNLLFTGANYTTSVLTADTTYYVTVANTLTNCETHRTPLNVTVNATPNISIIPNSSICAGDSIDIGGPSVAGNSYSWTSNPAGFTSSLANPSVSPSTTTTYYITQEIIATGCSNSAQVTINISPLPVAPTSAFSDQNNFCSNSIDSIKLSAAGGSGATLNWYSNSCGGSLLSSGNNVFIAAPNSTSTYYAAWENVCGISDCQSITINVLPSPTANAGDHIEVCFGNPVSVSGSGGPTYIWSNGQTNASFTYTPLNNDTLVLRVTASNGCTDQDTIFIKVNPLPIPVISPDTSICEGDQLVLNASGGVSYSWSSGETTSNIIVEPTVSTTYNVTVTDANGCSADATTNVEVLSTTDILVSVNPNGTILTGQLVTFSVMPDTLEQYNFYVNDILKQSSSSNIFVTSNLIPNDVVTVSVETSGCPTPDKIIKPKIIEFYNSFTPNSDGINDIFMQGVNLTIINRWGQILYQGYEGWDGTFEGADVSQGTYFFIVKLSDETGNENEVKGSVTLIR